MNAGAWLPVLWWLLNAIASPGSPAETATTTEQASQVIAPLDGVLREKPDDVPARLALGWAHLQLDQYQQALNAFSHVILAHPDSAEACRGRALALVGLKDIPKATEWAKKATQLAPEDALTWRDLARIYMHPSWRDAPRAEQALKKALQLRPDERSWVMELGRALNFQRKTDAAIALFTDWLGRHPEDCPAKVKLAEILYTVRQLARATDLLQEVRSACPDEPDALRVLEQVDTRRAYQFWVPFIGVLALPGFYLLIRRLRRGRIVKDPAETG